MHQGDLYMADVQKYLNLARRAREENNAEDAKKFYDMVRIEDPENYEARFFYSYYTLWSGRKMDAVSNYKALIATSMSIVKDLLRAADSAGPLQDIGDFLSVMINCVKSLDKLEDLRFSMARYDAVGLFCIIGDVFDLFAMADETYKKHAIDAWLTAERYCYEPMTYIPSGIDLDEYVGKIQKYDPSYISRKQAIEAAAQEKERRKKEEAEAKEQAKRKKAEEDAKAKAKREEEIAQMPKWKQGFARLVDKVKGFISK